MFGMRKKRRGKKAKVVGGAGADTLEQIGAEGLEEVIPENMFNEGERVLAFHDDDLLYEGKVMEMYFAKEVKKWNYWIHYAGWSHRWDAWIHEDQVLKYSEGNLEQQKNLKMAHDAVMGEAGKSPRRYSRKKSTVSEPSSDIESSIDSPSSTPVAVVAPKARRSVKKEPESEPAKETKKNDCVDPEEGHSNPKQELRIKVLKKSVRNGKSVKVEPESEQAKETKKKKSDCVDPENLSNPKQKVSKISKKSIGSGTSGLIGSSIDSISSVPVVEPAEPVLAKVKKKRDCVESNEGHSNPKQELRIKVLKKSIEAGTSGVILSTTDSSTSTPIVNEEALNPVKVEPAELELAEGEDGDLFLLEESDFNPPTQKVSIVIPKLLEKFLVLDWQSVTCLKRLVKLPARITIEQIFTEYLIERKRCGRKSVELHKIVCDGLRTYFNELIGTQLLYPLEKAQFKQLKDTNEEKQMTEIYGAAHLLRLFTRLGPWLATAALDAEGIADIEKCIHNFFQFMVKNYESYLTLEDYVSCPEIQDVNISSKITRVRRRSRN